MSAKLMNFKGKLVEFSSPLCNYEVYDCMWDQDVHCECEFPLKALSNFKEWRCACWGLGNFLASCLILSEKNQVPGGVPLPETLERMTYAHRTEDEKRETQAPLGTSSIAAVTGDFSRPSAQRRSRSASAAYTARPCERKQCTLFSGTDSLGLAIMG
jgi:hypothetical protein